MKIAFVSSAKSIHIVRWANAFSDRGHQVTVITCKGDCGSNVSLYRENVEIIQLKFAAPFGYYLNARQLNRIIRKRQFDVVNVHYASGYGTLGRKAKQKYALLNIWGSDVYEFPYRNSFNMRTVKANLSFYKYAASTSECMAKQARSLVDRDYYITPFGVDMNLFAPIEGVRPNNEIIFGTVKTLSPKYGISDTIHAFIRLYQRLQSEKKNDLADKLRYEIYGSGEQREELQQLIDSNRMTDKIKLCGYVANCELPKIYSRFIVSNSNSISESFGVAAVEAMACGIPVQVSDAEGFVEVVEAGVTGLIAPKGDIQAISENMYTLLMNEELRNQMGKEGVKRVKQLYDWNKNVDEMEKIYQTIVGRGLCLEF